MFRPAGRLLALALAAVVASAATGRAQTALYVAAHGDRIYQVAPGGGVVTTFALEDDVRGIAVHSSGTVYAARFTTGVVVRYTSAGTLIDSFASGLGNPSDIDFDAAGNLYVNDSNGTSIRKVTPGGVVSTYATGIIGSFGMTFDTAGNLFTNHGNNIVRVAATDQQVTFYSNSGFDSPAGQAFDAAGFLYVANSGTLNGGVSRIPPGGGDATGFSQGGATRPLGLAYGPNGVLYGTDVFGQPAEVVSFSPSGVPSPYASFSNGGVAEWDIEFAPVPEPAGVLAFCAAAGGLIATVRRWRRPS